jgi:apolipoprotein N-acyltransferase
MGFSVAAIIAVVALVYIACHGTGKKDPWIVFLFQLPLWFWLEHWIFDVSVGGWIGLSLYMSIWAPLFVSVLRRVHLTPRLQHISIVLSAPVIWVSLECLRGIILFDGYPWFLIGTGLVDSALAQIAAIGSVWLVSFAAVFWSASLVRIRHLNTCTAAIALFTLLGSFLYGMYIEKGPIPTRLPIALIQTNVPQSNKMAWTTQQQEQDVAAAISLSKEALKEKTKFDQAPRLIVWPETMLPGSGFELQGIDFAPYTSSAVSLWGYAEKIRSLSQELDIPLLVGSHTWTGVDIEESETQWLNIVADQEFNSAVLVRPDGSTTRYDKSFLTPFGERIPYVNLWPAFEEIVRDTVGVAMLFSLDAGDGKSNFILDGVCGSENKPVRIGTPICFEDTIPFVVRNVVWKDNKRQVEVLINMSNDGWFGDMNWARLQHVREARMRCIENRTPMVRVANTGQSCLIDSRGSVQSVAMNNGEEALQKPATLLVSPLAGWQLPLSRFTGDGVAWLSLFGGILLIVCTFQSRSTQDES